MPELDRSLEMALRWEGDDDFAAAWAEENRSAIEEEAQGDYDGVMAEAINSLFELAESSDDVAAWGLANLFRTPLEAAGHLWQKFTSLTGAGARRVRSLFQPLSVLFQRYAPRLIKLARKLGATGYSIGVNFPLGISFALNFDFPPAPARP